jgi:RNA polymerase sigma-70 factor (ECF subfamily)
MSSTDVASALRRSRPRDTAESLAGLYDRYHREVFHLALRYGQGDTAWAEDVMNDIFLELLSTPRVIFYEEQLSAWFYRVTTNRCLNKLRHEALLRSAPVRWLLGADCTGPQTPEMAALERDELARAFEAVNALPIKERLAFFMHHVDGKDQAEIAHILGHSKGYVSKLLKRAGRRLTCAGWKVEHAE